MIPNKVKGLLLLAFLFGMLGRAQAQANLDSLWNVWQDEGQPDTVRARALGRYAWSKYLYQQPDSAEYYGQLMYDFAEQHGSKKWMAWALRGQGVTYKIRGANAKALDYWLRSMEMSGEVKDLSGVAGSENNIGILYFELGDLSRSLEYHHRSLGLRRICNDSIGEGASLSSIGEIHRKLGQLDSAMHYQMRSLQHSERIRYLPGIGIAHKCLGDLYRDRKEFTTALEHFRLGKELLGRANNELMLAECISREGFTHLDMGHPAKALASCERSLAQAAAATNLDGQKLACDCLYEAYRSVGRRDLALLYLERSTAIGDSLRMEDLAQQLQRMEFTKELAADSTLQAERDQSKALVTAAALSHEKTRKNFFLIAVIAVLLLAGGLWSRLRYVDRSTTLIKAEKERSDDLLLNILPADVARELKEKGASQARNIHQATILFSDFKGFTELSEELSATDLVAEIDACFEAFDGIMDKYGVEKIKTIGDAYMAAGGLPVPSADSVQNTVRAALEMQEFITRRKAEGDALGKPAFEMRVGIHTGPVVAGIVGVKKFQYDLWGDTVNTAHRMETTGEVGRVNISASTHGLVMDLPEFVFIPRGSVQVKGKGDMDMFFVSRSVSEG